MIAPYLASWRSHPAFNMLFVGAMAVSWAIYAFLHVMGIPLESQQANIFVFFIAALCFVFIVVLPRYSFRLVAVHHFIMVATLLPSLTNGKELLRLSGIFG